MKNHHEIKWLGGTRDDAAGEAFDKTGRLLNLPYPAGPLIEKLASTATKTFIIFQDRLSDQMISTFLFSGLKTAVLREVKKIKMPNDNDIKNISFSLQQAIFAVLIKKTFKAVRKYNAKSILLGGGVAAIKH